MNPDPIQLALLEGFTSQETGTEYRGDWATPWEDFLLIVNAGFLFSLDAAASAQNAKCVNFISAEQDALTQAWTVPPGSFWWCNPDFRLSVEFILKAYEEMQAGNPGIMLLPANTDRPLFALIEQLGLRVLFWGTDTPGVSGRINFIDPTNQKRTANFKGSILVAFTQQETLSRINGRGWWTPPA